MGVRRYPDYPKEVNDLLDFAREVRKFQRLYPEEVSAADITQHLADFAGGWGWDLLDLVLDHEERIGGLWSKWKRWRNEREFIRRIARPNATFLGYGLPPEPVKKKKAPKRWPEIEMVSRVMIEQGRTFADSFIECARQSEVPDDAFSAAHVMMWPDDNPEAQARFHAITDDIFKRFWTEIREPVARVFVEAANEVLTRERGK